ncbi:DUF2971 domain-containing protein [Flavobacterium pedocola]
MKKMDDTLPEFFYKYTKIENVIKTLENKTIWFSSPKDFNDPFDCNIKLIDFTPSEEDIVKLINEKVAGNRALRRKEIQKNKQNPFRIKNQMNEQFQEVFYSSGVCCFSEINDDILMWSHYAENHKGICLKFNSSISNIADMTAKVKYSPTFEKEKFFSGDPYSVYHLVFTKSNNWFYEKEIRAVKMLYNGKIEFDIMNLTEIIFGCKTEETNIKLIKKLILELGYKHIICKQAVLTNSSFKLKIH